MENLTVYPILLQFLTSIILMFLWTKNVLIQKYISVISSIFAVMLSGYLFWHVYTQGVITLNAGMWKAPFGITFVADTLSATLVLLCSISGLAVSAYSTATISNARLRFGFLPVFHFLLTGLCGAFLTGDIFNLYVWFEIIIITSFVLLSLGGERAQLEGAIKYFTLNIISSTFFLTALGVLYGITGTLNMADLHLKMADVSHQGLVQTTAVLFLIGFGTKAAIFPFFYWLPASYHTPPAPVSAIFGGLLTKVGVYALIRVFMLIFPANELINNIMLCLAIFTLITGGMGALVQNNIVKIFAYLIICHIGFMILGLAMRNTQALTGTINYLIHDIIVKTNLFLIAGLIYKIKGTHSLRDLGGLYKQYPKISLLIFVSFLAVIGVPPFSGFWPKISLIQGALKFQGWEGAVFIAGIIFASFITLAVIAKLWAEAFWKKPIEIPKIKQFKYFDDLQGYQKIEMIIPILLLTCATLYVSFRAENILLVSQKIAFELMNAQTYVKAVLGV